jgi:hypothetical protein
VWYSNTAIRQLGAHGNAGTRAGRARSHAIREQLARSLRALTLANAPSPSKHPNKKSSAVTFLLPPLEPEERPAAAGLPSCPAAASAELVANDWHTLATSVPRTSSLRTSEHLPDIRPASEAVPFRGVPPLSAAMAQQALKAAPCFSRPLRGAPRTGQRSARPHTAPARTGTGIPLRTNERPPHTPRRILPFLARGAGGAIRPSKCYQRNKLVVPHAHWVPVGETSTDLSPCILTVYCGRAPCLWRRPAHEVSARAGRGTERVGLRQRGIHNAPGACRAHAGCISVIGSNRLQLLLCTTATRTARCALQRKRRRSFSKVRATSVSRVPHPSPAMRQAAALRSNESRDLAWQQAVHARRGWCGGVCAGLPL